MGRYAFAAAFAGLALLGAAPAFAAPAAAPPAATPALTPTQIIDAAPDADWVSISPDDLLVMELAPDAKGAAREVVIQLIPAPFSQGWVGNVRKLAAAHWWDGLSVNRVQDNYVAQWGDANGDDPKLARKLPEGLAVVGERGYSISFDAYLAGAGATRADWADRRFPTTVEYDDPYSSITSFWKAFPIAFNTKSNDPVWPIHCYATVGVGRDYPPDTGTGAELYAVIGTPPRQLDRNIAIIGRVIAGIENLSSLPRGTGDLGFYKTAAERTPILSVRLASELPAAQQPHLQYLSTESASFAHYADARANRRDPFYIHPAGGVDICNVPVPVRRAPPH